MTHTVEIEIPEHLVVGVLDNARLVKAYASTPDEIERADHIEELFLDALSDLDEEYHGE